MKISLFSITEPIKIYFCQNLPCLAIGKATANTIESLGGKVIYQPKTFYAVTLAEDIVSKFKDKNILYLRPKDVSFDSKTFLKNAGLTLQEQIIYETSCVTYESKDKPLKNAIIIFTSPSSIHCFLENFEWNERRNDRGQSSRVLMSKGGFDKDVRPKELP